MYLYILISIVTKIAVSARKWVRAVEIGSQLKVATRIGCGGLLVITNLKNDIT